PALQLDSELDRFGRVGVGRLQNNVGEYLRLPNKAVARQLTIGVPSSRADSVQGVNYLRLDGRAEHRTQRVYLVCLQRRRADRAKVLGDGEERVADPSREGVCGRVVRRLRRARLSGRDRERVVLRAAC